MPWQSIHVSALELGKLAVAANVIDNLMMCAELRQLAGGCAVGRLGLLDASRWQAEVGKQYLGQLRWAADIKLLVGIAVDGLLYVADLAY